MSIVSGYNIYSHDKNKADACTSVKATVVIPAHNRPKHLCRLIKYFSTKPVNIIIADSSTEVFPFLREYEHLIQYQHHPNIPLAEKIVHILPLINTPYVFMCADDDFIIIDSVISIIKFLETHEDYNSAQGWYVDFSLHKSKVLWNLRYPNMTSVDLNDTTGSERVQSLMSNYFQYYYCVFRKELFCEVFRSTMSNNECLISNLNLLEIYTSLYPAIFGKHIVLPFFYCARENIIDSAGSYTDSVFVVSRDDRYSKEFENFKIKLSKALALNDGIPESLARARIDFAVNSYLEINYPKRNLLYYIGRFLYRKLKKTMFGNLIFKFYYSTNRTRLVLPENIRTSPSIIELEHIITTFYKA